MIKRTLSLLFVLCLLPALCACNAKTADAPGSPHPAADRESVRTAGQRADEAVLTEGYIPSRISFPDWLARARGWSTESDTIWLSGVTPDRAPVIVTFEKAPDTASEGNRTVTLVARDPYGNETRADAVLTVIADHDPPVIYGTADQKVLIGGTVSFRKNVWAEDARDGSVNVTVDSSAVNLNAVGVYPVVYYASDASGNTATATAYITSSRSANSSRDLSA